ncbi:MAG: hypothetical protein D6803_05925 [Anaerolineae bacterium]|nr:MAG: hypothetical protein D6803_05925 [Anaerolineae bacterium]
MKRFFTLPAFLYLTLGEGVLALVILILIPGDPKNAWLLGFSRLRLAMLAFGILIVTGLGIGVRAILRTKPRLGAWRAATRRALAWDGHVTTALVICLVVLLAGSYFLLTTFTSTDAFLLGYFYRLAPWVFWLTAFALQCLIALIYYLKQEQRTYFRDHGLALILIVAVLALGYTIHTSLWSKTPQDWDVHHIFNRDGKFDLEEQDIHAVYTEGGRLSRGINPYARVLEQGGDMQWNLTFPAYLPVMYSLSALVEGLGVRDYLDYLSVMRWFFLAANLGIAYLLFYIPYHRYNAIFFALFGALFWLMDRWVVHITMIYHFDFLALLPFLLSLALWPKHRRLALVLFGISIAVKHMAIFMAPVFLIWAWQEQRQPSLTRLLADALLMGAAPLIISLPFMVWNLEGFFKSLLISLTRVAESHFGVPDFATVFSLQGVSAKLPMFGLFALVYILAWRGKLRPFAAGLLIMAAFLDFNAVLFRHYMLWTVPLIPLAACEILQRNEKAASHNSPL